MDEKCFALYDSDKNGTYAASKLYEHMAKLISGKGIEQEIIIFQKRENIGKIMKKYFWATHANMKINRKNTGNILIIFHLKIYLHTRTFNRMNILRLHNII